MQKLRKGDQVEVTTGENQGGRGRVLSVLTDDRLIVEGVNLRWKHLKRSQQHPQGGRIEKEAPIHRSNVLVVSEETDAAQRVRIVTFAGKRSDGKERTLRYRVGVKDGQPISAADKALADQHQASKG